MKIREIYFGNVYEKGKKDFFAVLRPEQIKKDNYCTLFETVIEACSNIVHEKGFPVQLNFPAESKIIIYRPYVKTVFLSPLNTGHIYLFKDGIEDMILAYLEKKKQNL